MWYYADELRTCLGSSSEGLNRGELVPDVQGPGGQPIGRRAIWSVGGAESLLWAQDLF